MSRLTVIVVAAFIAVLAAAISIPVRVDSAYIDVHTGSRYGETMWIGSIKSNQWSMTSDLESRLLKMGVKPISRWISYQGTGRSIFGSVRYRGHGRPGPILQVNTDQWAEFLLDKTDDFVVSVYETLRNGDRREVAEVAEQVYGLSDMGPTSH